MPIEKPTIEEVTKSLKLIDDICILASIHGVYTNPEPSLIKTLKWLAKEFHVENYK